MKLAEALTLRGDLDRKIKELRNRIQTTARYVEGEEPLENVGELLAETRRLIGEQAKLIARINHTNSVTVVNGMTLAEELAERGRLSAEASLLKDAATYASPGRNIFGERRRVTELREVASLPVPALRAEADDLSQEHRELDTLIQQKNWETELQ